jgi:transposase
VLKPVIFPWFDSLTAEQKKEFMFMEDGLKIHARMAKLPCKLRGLRGFDWPPSSPDLNLIEKIWRWMKNKITKLEAVPTLIEDIKEVLTEL